MNEIYLRRRSKLVLPRGEGTLPPEYLATALKNLEALGYTFSQALADACRALTPEVFVGVYVEIVPILQRLKGAHRSFTPFYPNFPEQVMDLSEAELYVNAMVHYWSGGALYPATAPKERFPLRDRVEPTVIDLGTTAELDSLFTQLVGGNTSLSEQDRADVAQFIQTYGDSVALLLPDTIPQKETLAFVAGLLLDRVGVLSGVIKTATDVLRLAVALSGGDLSLATPGRFKTFSRPERRLLLGLLERQHHLLEDMLQHKTRWIRLGEKLHPGEWAAAYPKAARAFQALRNNAPVTTVAGQVEAALAAGKVAEAVALLEARPGELARRLDHLLRRAPSASDTVLAAFARVAPKVSTPVLVQVRHHFLVRSQPRSLRVFFPKGSVAKAQGIENTLPALSAACRVAVVQACEAALVARFAVLPPLGKTYLDPELAHYLVPFSQRSASCALRTLVRGSRLPLPACDILRFFIWWKNGLSRTDIDLSAVLYNSAFEYVDVLSYYSLKAYGGVHSGDIVDAPDGASEFIDLTLEKVRAQGVRYIVMSVNSYTGQPFVALPECFAGWMARKKPGSGEVYEPKTVQDRLDLSADTKIAIPLVIDVVASQVIWCDLALRRHPRWHNNVHTNKTGIQLALRSLVELTKPNLYDLLSLHTQARGEWVASAEEAETVFSVAAGTPFQLETLAAEYLGN